jgi:hypothetical protein
MYQKTVIFIVTATKMLNVTSIILLLFLLLLQAAREMSMKTKMLIVRDNCSCGMRDTLNKCELSCEFDVTININKHAVMEVSRLIIINRKNAIIVVLKVICFEMMLITHYS